MSDTRDTPTKQPANIEEEEIQLLQALLNGLNTQKAGIEQQAKAIRQRLGKEEKQG